MLAVLRCCCCWPPMACVGIANNALLFALCERCPAIAGSIGAHHHRRRHPRSVVPLLPMLVDITAAAGTIHEFCCPRRLLSLSSSACPPCSTICQTQKQNCYKHTDNVHIIDTDKYILGCHLRCVVVVVEHCCGAGDCSGLESRLFFNNELQLQCRRACQGIGVTCSNLSHSYTW